MLFSDIFHQPFNIIIDMSSATVSRLYDSSCYFVCTYVDMLDDVSRLVQAPCSQPVQLRSTCVAERFGIGSRLGSEIVHGSAVLAVSCRKVKSA